MGKDRGLKLYSFGMQGFYGDLDPNLPNCPECIKPWFGDIIGVWKWDAWNDLKGTDKTLAM